MAKIVLVNDDGTEEVLYGGLTGEVISLKVWTDEDIRSSLLEKGFSCCEENVSAVKDSGTKILSHLEEVTYQEWETVYSAILEADRIQGLVKAEKEVR